MGHIILNYERFQVGIYFWSVLIFLSQLLANLEWQILLQVTDTPGLLTRHDGSQPNSSISIQFFSMHFYQNEPMNGLFDFSYYTNFFVCKVLL